MTARRSGTQGTYSTSTLWLAKSSLFFSSHVMAKRENGESVLKMISRVGIGGASRVLRTAVEVRRDLAPTRHYQQEVVNCKIFSISKPSRYEDAARLACRRSRDRRPRILGCEGPSCLLIKNLQYHRQNNSLMLRGDTITSIWLDDRRQGPVQTLDN